MNLVGKIFTVLIFVMSLVFMTMAVMVYAMHQNWKDVVLRPQAGPGQEIGLKLQLEQARARTQELKDQHTKLEADLAREQAEKRQALAKLENELDELRRERDTLEMERAKLVEAERTAVATMKDTQATLAAMRLEVDRLREEIRVAQQDRDKSFQDVVRLTDEVHLANNELKRLRERGAQLAADIAKYRGTMQRLGYDPDREYREVPPPVNGEVIATPQEGLVEISIGSDDGLEKGHQLDVFRTSGGGASYLGKIIVVSTADDRAVGKVDANTRQGSIQRGDRVVSQLN